MKSICAVLLVALMGCAARSEPASDSVSSASSNETSTAHYSGSFGETWEGCGAKVLQGGSCSASGGAIVDSALSTTPSTGPAWHCKVKPFDTVVGADMTITVTCQ